MEEPGPPMSDLFMKMKQIFPEIPLPVIQFNVICYGSDPAVCQHMLELHRQYSASTSSSSINPLVNQLNSLNIKSTTFTESATGQGSSHMSKPSSQHTINHNQEFENYNPQYLREIIQNTSTDMMGMNRNLSYAGITTSPPHVLIPNPVLSAPVTSSLDYHQGFNNTFHSPPKVLQALGQPSSAGRSVSPGVAFIPTSVDSVPVSSSPVQTFSNVPGPTRDPSKIVWEAYPNVNNSVKPPYDSQLYINVDPYYNYAHYPNSDQHHSPYDQFPNSLGQHPMQLEPAFIHGGSDHTNASVGRSDLFGADNQRPQLVISSPYWNKNYNSTVQNVQNPLANGQLCSEKMPVHGAGNSSLFRLRFIGDNLRHQTETLNSLKYEIQQNRHVSYQCGEEIKKLEQQLKYKTCLPDKKMIQDMKDEITKLRFNCHYLCMEVDLQLKGSAPLGMVDEDFYRTIFTGQQGPLLPDTEQTSQSPSPSSGLDQRQVSIEEEENKESSTWKCNMCTFANHPAISVCEMCHIPRSSLPGLSESESLLKHDLRDAAAP